MKAYWLLAFLCCVVLALLLFSGYGVARLIGSKAEADAILATIDRVGA